MFYMDQNEIKWKCHQTYGNSNPFQSPFQICMETIHGQESLKKKVINFLLIKKYAQCAEEKSNEDVEDMDRTFAGW